MVYSIPRGTIFVSKIFVSVKISSLVPKVGLLPCSPRQDFFFFFLTELLPLQLPTFIFPGGRVSFLRECFQIRNYKKSDQKQSNRRISYSSATNLSKIQIFKFLAPLCTQTGTRRNFRCAVFSISHRYAALYHYFIMNDEIHIVINYSPLFSKVGVFFREKSWIKL